MNEKEKKVINFDDLVSQTAIGVSNPASEEHISKKYLQRKKELLAGENDKTFINPTRDKDIPHVFEEVFFAQKHNGKNLEIEGLEEHRNVTDDLNNKLKPVLDIFQLARDIISRSDRAEIKKKFYSKEEIKVKNDLTVSSFLFFGSIAFFVIMAAMFALFKNRLIMFGSVLTMVGCIVSGILYYTKKEANILFNTKKFKAHSEDISEIRVRLKKLKEDVAYFQAIRFAEKIPNFEMEFSTKVNHVMDLIGEFEHIPEREYEKREHYYQEILNTLEAMTKYEKNTFDKYFFEKFKNAD